MTRLIALTAILLATTAVSAQAGESYSFSVGGHTVHIDAPRGCDSPSCVSVSIPGVYQTGPRRGGRRYDDDRDDADDRQASRPTVSEPTPAQAAPVAAPPRSEQSLEPANGSAKAAIPAASAASVATRTEEVSRPSNALTASPGGLAAPAIASNAATSPAPQTTTAASSPLGVWLTEEKEGKVRIEECGTNLCGYSVDKNEKVLINMKPVGAKWSGRIHDPKSGGNYDSTIAMKGTDSLRVQGCAFGGMFCGGQTWTRVN